MTIRIDELSTSRADDEALEGLLHESYVVGGFTSAEAATTRLRATAVRARGTVLLARDATGTACGTITLVSPGSPSRRLGRDSEWELHLLCVRPGARRQGVGRALVRAALTRAAVNGASRIVLWTQPAMHAAQRLYDAFGFRRDPTADFAAGGREFLVYRLTLPGADSTATMSPPDLTIRQFHPDDLAGVVSLWERCKLVRPWNDPHKDIARKTQMQDDGFLVGVIAGEIVATVMVGYDGHRGWINYLAVSPDYQRHGIGRQIMDEAERMLRARGCPKINLQIRRGNDAVAFYRAIGYLEDDVVSMGKRLESDGRKS